VSVPNHKTAPSVRTCPFCGGGSLVPWDKGERTHWVHCKDCGAEGPPSATKGGAWEWWNTRNPETLDSDGNDGKA
jgi:Restriction alleviation protein Lar